MLFFLINERREGKDVFEEALKRRGRHYRCASSDEMTMMMMMMMSLRMRCDDEGK